jgi:hypothetical protein
LITPQPEKIFYLTRINPLNFKEYRKFRHIILLGTLNSNGKFSNYIKGILDEKQKKDIREGRYFYFIKHNEFSLEQTILILVANNVEELKENIVENKGFIFNQFNRALDTYVINSMFGRKENMELSNKLYKSYGWTFRMQPDYIIAKEVKEGKFLWLRRFDPDRMISIYWKDSNDGSELNEIWAFERRILVGKNYLNNMKMVEGYTKIEKINFLGRDAIKLEGLWEIEEKAIGGFFRSYTFFDMKTKKIYFIDISVFAPGEVKEPYIRQLDIIAHTFSTSPIKPFKKILF